MKPSTLYPFKNGVTGVTRVTPTNNPLYLLNIFSVTRTAKLLNATCYIEQSCYRKATPSTLLALAPPPANRCNSLGEANQALLMASLYRQVEQMDVFKKGFNTSSLMHRVLDDAFSTKATKRGQEAGNGNRNPSSAIKTAAMDRRTKIKAAAEQIISGRKSEKRSLTDAELTNLLFDQAGNGTKKTIREHLTALGLRPLK